MIEIKPADILRFCGKGPLSNQISQITGCETTHVALVLGYLKEIHDWLIIEAYEGEGFLRGLVDVEGLRGKLSGYEGECYVCHLDPRLDIYRESICSAAWDKRRTPYDYWNLFGNVFGRQDFDTKAFICSEFVQYCLYTGIPRNVLANYPLNEETQILFDSEISMIPGDFEHLSLIYEQRRLK